MENGATQWHKITFAEGEEVLQKPWQVTKEASQIHQESGLLRECAFFLDLDLKDGVRHVLYFHPLPRNSALNSLRLSRGRHAHCRLILGHPSVESFLMSVNKVLSRPVRWGQSLQVNPSLRRRTSSCLKGALWLCGIKCQHAPCRLYLAHNEISSNRS
jgi:hypothetical protein